MDSAAARTLRHRAGLITLALAISLVAMLSQGAGPASARYKLSVAFGGEGNADGKFKNPESVANAGFQPIWVTDSKRDDLQAFGEFGNFMSETGGLGASENKLKNPIGVAAQIAGPDNGNAFVIDAETGHIEEFADNYGVPSLNFGSIGNGHGKFTVPSGIAVSPIAPYRIYVSDVARNTIQEFSRTGTWIKTFGKHHLSAPRSLAIGPHGTVYAANTSSDQITAFTPSGDFKYEWTSAFPTGAEQPYDLAVDVESYVYVVGLGGEVGKFTPKGKFITTVGKYSGPGPGVISLPVSVDVTQIANQDGLEQVAVLDANHKVRVFEAVLPDTTITSGPSGESITDTTPTFKFSSDQSPVKFQCAVDSLDFSPCDKTTTLDPLPDGHHVLAVEAIDDDKLYDHTPAYSGFTVDTTPPTTTIDSGPSGNTADGTPTFGFSSNESSVTFYCSIDSKPATSCTSPLTTQLLGAGAHTFAVAAVDAAGNADASPATRSFTVTTGAPDTTITAGGGLTKHPTFSFTSSFPGSTFECELDAFGFGPCTSPIDLTGLSDGSYTFSVRATANAQTDATPASVAFTVDTLAPSSTITGGPSGNTQNHTPTFQFHADDPQATFECKVDSGNWNSCTSPKTIGHQDLGAHTFKVRATDLAGNVEAQPATRDFTVTN